MTETGWYTVVVRDILGKSTKYHILKEPQMVGDGEILLIELDDDRKICYNMTHVVSFSINHNEGTFIPYQTRDDIGTDGIVFKSNTEPGTAMGLDGELYYGDSAHD